jgi:hypothetical protein
MFSCLALLNMFSAVSSSLSPVFMICASGLIFGGTEGDRSRTRFRRYRGRRVPFSSFALLDSFSEVPRASATIFMFCTPGLIFNDTEGVGSRFHVLRTQTYFRRYRRRPVPFSCFALQTRYFIFMFSSFKQLYS